MNRSLAFAFILAACETAAPPSTPVTTLAAAPVALSRVTPTFADLASEQGGQAVSLDERGVPRLILAMTGPSTVALDGSAEAAARTHLTRFLKAQDVDMTALNAAKTVGVRDLGEGGRLVILRQQIDQLDVVGSDVKVLLRPDNALVAISGALKRPQVDRSAFDWTAQRAVARAVTDRVGFAVAPSDVTPRGEHAGWELMRVEGDGLAQLSEPAHVRPVWFSDGKLLRPAYLVEFQAPVRYGAELELFRSILSATDGRVFERAELTAYDAFNYRVWADATTKQPADGPSVDFTPHPTGVPDGVRPPFAPSTLVSVEGLNLNPLGVPDPWLPAAATETSGNNIDAYSDTQLPDGYTNGDLRATVTGTRTFDRTYDLNASPTDGGIIAPNQLMASIAQAFYTTNWLHDYWYDRGFTEGTGNNQLNNFGRGGVGGDPMHVEVQDRALAVPPQSNNANMSSPSDGFSPRMQIFVWSGYGTRDLKTSLSANSILTGVAAFGPSTFTATGDLLLANDGVGTASDACTALMAPATGRIVIADRGTCTFKTKALNVMNAGAAGMILANNAAGGPPGLADDATILTPITIGTLSVSQADGNTLKTGLMAGTVTVSVFNRFSAAQADGALDNAVVAHEYGHFLHHRLQDCSTYQCGGMSEGWGDFVALHMVLRDGDNLDATFADTTYAGMGSSLDGAYFGIRRYPYSTDLTKCPLTFKYVADQGDVLPAGIPANPASPTLSEVHNAGEIWAATLFDSYVALQKARPTTETFDVVRHRFAKDLVNALQLAPRDSTYTEMRDAILATLSARSATDRDVVAQAFARRGMGTCATSPPRTVTGPPVMGVTEATTLAPWLSVGAVTLNDATKSCDMDGVLDGDEQGVLTLRISNAGAQAATGTTLTITTTTAGVTLPNGGMVTVPTVAPYQTVTVPVAVALAASTMTTTDATFDVAVANPTSCTSMLTTQLVTRLNTDEQLAASATDDAEASQAASTPTGALATQVWQREAITAPNHVWHGADLGELTDTALETPALSVAATGNFVVTFNHAYSFEYDTMAWDGAVIELSENGGPWQDVTAYMGVTPGYGGTLVNPVNPLGTTRQVYQHTNPSYPAADPVTLDFGTQLAGKSVKLRFRIGTDAAAGDFGWQLDDIHFAGITNTPFATVVADTHFCNRAPVAAAGMDRTVLPGAAVLLDASGSTDPDGNPLTFTWAQTAGPTVTLQSTNGVVTGFTAPAAAAMDAVLTFRVTVSDGTQTATDTVDITVSADRAPVANAGMDRTVTRGAAVLLDANGSTDPDGNALTFTWTQTAGPTVTLQNASGSVASFVAPAAAATATVLTFRVSVSDGTLSATDTVDITVSANRAPVANAGQSKMVGSGALVLLDGSGSSDPDGDALTFTWSQTAGPMVTPSSTTSAVTAFTAPVVTADTPLTFSLTVADGVTDATATVTLTVIANRSPMAVASGPAYVGSGAMGTLTAADSTDPEGEPLTFAWTQSAGPAATIATPSKGITTFTAPAVTADTPITFLVTVSDGHTDATATVDVTVKPNLAPGANAGSDLTLKSGEAAILSGSGTDPEGKPLTYFWKQSSGSVSVTLAHSTDPVASFVAPPVQEKTTLEFTLTVTDDAQLTGTDTATVTIEPAKSGCGCSAGGGPLGALLLLGLALKRRRPRG